MTEAKSEGKGRPTPKRKEAEAKRVRRALAPAATKQAKREQREQARSQRALQREAYMRGEESALPARDRGPAKRLARDLIDARRSLAEYLMPLVFIVLLLSIIRNPRVQILAAVLLYAVMLAAIVDTFILANRIKKEVRKRYPTALMRGMNSYVILRTSQIRRLRIPRPMVERGEKV